MPKVLFKALLYKIVQNRSLRLGGVCWAGNRMLETVSQFAVGFLVGLSGTLLPGPMLAFITMKSLSFGKKNGGVRSGGAYPG